MARRIGYPIEIWLAVEKPDGVKVEIDEVEGGRAVDRMSSPCPVLKGLA
jgi:hypothetical protein